LGSLLTKVAAAAVVPRIVKALSALGGPPEPIRAHPSQDAPKPVSEFARPPEKALYGQKPLTEHKKQYFGQGEVRGATKLYYATDHLGSVRELVDSAGTVQAEYSYSTYGERTKVSGNLDSDWGYAGLWHHQASGLDLATYRAYDAANKRWISRDPLGEGVDYNLYRYCGNNPINCTDSSGLHPILDYVAQQIGPLIVNAPRGLEATVQVLRPLAGPIARRGGASLGGPLGIGAAGLYGLYEMIPENVPNRPFSGRLSPNSGPITIPLPGPPAGRNAGNPTLNFRGRTFETTDYFWRRNRGRCGNMDADDIQDLLDKGGWRRGKSNEPGRETWTNPNLGVTIVTEGNEMFNINFR
ncbi:MAG: RHS repeat-associated core domain-containing protein, partial [Vulcanimicrobiota bacterium]